MREGIDKYEAGYEVTSIYTHFASDVCEARVSVSGLITEQSQNEEEGERGKRSQQESQQRSQVGDKKKKWCFSKRNDGRQRIDRASISLQP